MNANRQPALTILIVSWNSWHYLAPCLRSILASDFTDYTILVVDNDSHDDTIDNLTRQFPAVRLLRNDCNVGHTRAVNQGLRECHSDLVLVLDADTELVPDALRLLVDFLAEHPRAGLAAPRTYNSDGTIQESARGFPSASSGFFGRQSLLTRIFPNNPFSRRYLKRDQINAVRPFRVDQMASACMLLRSNLISRHGEWDEGYPGYFVETDWCFRLRRAGIEAWCVPAAKVLHHEQNNRHRRRGARRIWMFHQGALRFYRKNCSLGWLDPRTLLAAVALCARASMLIALDTLKPQAACTNTGKSATALIPAGKQEIGAANWWDSEPRPLLAIEAGANETWESGLVPAAYRLFEFIFSALALLLTLPIMIVVAIMIKLDSPGPILFFMQRLGRSRIVRGADLIGRRDIAPVSGDFDPEKSYYVPTTFTFVKFRTMHADSYERFPELYRRRYESYDELLADYCKKDDDPRVTRVGRWLRKLTIDEFPNFWNVLTGSIGLVGPRPDGLFYAAFYKAEDMRKFTVRPGITGLAQINGRGHLSIGQTNAWDLKYVRERSVALDLRILLRTFILVVTRHGAF